MKDFRRHGNQKGPVQVREQSVVAVQGKNGVIILLPSGRHRVAVQVSEAVVHRPQHRVVVEQRVPQHRMFISVHIVVDITRESVGY